MNVYDHHSVRETTEPEEESMEGGSVGPPPEWDATQIPRQDDKISIVTGANSGIGFVTARELVRKGAHVILACRTERKGNEAVKRIQEEISATESLDEAAGTAEFMQLDVSSLASVQTFVQSFKAKFDRLHLLVNNAGIMAVPYAETVDGYESQFATNHLGHFALTASLFDLLKCSVPSRVVNVSSNAHRLASLDLEELMTPQSKYWAMTVYGNSKLSNILFTLELSRHLKAQGLDGVLSVAAHPGTTASNLVVAPAQTSNWFMWLMWRIAAYIPIYQSTDMGALPTLYAASGSDVSSGQYFGPGGIMAQWGYPALEVPSAAAQSEESANKLWRFSEKLAKLRFLVE